jgi:uncharacterized membrane protein (UPF0127 family)
LIAAAIAVGAAIFVRHNHRQPVEPAVNPPAVTAYRKLPVTLGGQQFIMEVADTPAQQELGLGKRDSLAADYGMLFAFTSAGLRCFWMKDMRFPLDIIWIGSDKKIGHIEKSLSPDTYPQSYCPQLAARYVIELNAGTADKLGLHDGDVLPINP